MLFVLMMPNMVAAADLLMTSQDRQFFRLTTDGMVTKLPNNLAAQSKGLAFVGSTLYSLDRSSGSEPVSLRALNPETGQTLTSPSVKTVALSGVVLTDGFGLASHPQTGQLFAIVAPDPPNTSGGLSGAASLVTINPATGVATQVGSLLIPFVGLAFNGSGTLFGVSGSNAPTGSKNQLYSVNQTTGATTFIMNLADPLSSNIPHAIGFHQVTDRLYHLSGGSSGMFEEINLSTLARTPISLISGFTPFGNAMALTALVRPNTVGSDLNGDGKTDLVWRNNSSGLVAVWLMNGLNIAASGFPAGVPLVWQIEGVGDVNGDGRADVIWRHSLSGTVAIWLMNGVAITSVGFPGSASTEFTIAGVGDVNGDGKADLVWRHTTNGTTAIWLMNGTTIAASGFPGGVPLVWQIAGVGDVDGDGQADIIWRNDTTGTVAVWLMNGLAITGVGFPGSAPTAFEIAGVGDVDGDGQADLVFHNTTTGTTAIWLMNGTVLAAAGFPGGVPSDWQMAQVGDVNGDGKADVIWRIGTSGTVAVWLMNGLTISSVGFPGSAPAEWEIQ
jgi:hypothetical protein